MPSSTSKMREFPREPVLSEYTWDFSGMDPLVEVFSVSLFIDRIRDMSSVDIDGTFQAYDIGRDNIDIYKPMNGCVSILPDGTLSLTGPFRCLAGDEWGLNICLKEKRQNLEICNGSLDMNTGSNNGWGWNKPLSAVVVGKDGYAVIYFMMFKSETAVQATIEVILDSSGDDCFDPPGLHGSIHARNGIVQFGSAIEEKALRTTLLNAPEERPVMRRKCENENQIPLLRSAVAVPLGSHLIVDSELFEGRTELARGSASFEAQRSGTSCQNIGGVKVKVSWAVDPFKAVGLKHPFSEYRPVYYPRRPGKTKKKNRKLDI